MATLDLASRAPHTYTHCQRLVTLGKYLGPIGNSQQIGTFQYEDGIEFDFTYKDMLHGASEGCTLCKYIAAETSLPEWFDYQRVTLVLYATAKTINRIGTDISSDTYAITNLSWYESDTASRIGYIAEGFSLCTNSGK
jgi:hypothetical protein